MTHFLQRTALIALATGALGAGSTQGHAEPLRPNFPIRLPDAADPAPAPTPAEAAPAVAQDEVGRVSPAAPVDAKPLDTPAAPAPAPTPAVAPPASRIAAPPAPTYRTVTTRSVTGKLVEVEGPATSYIVKKGDTLEKIARKLDTSVDQLREDNHLRRSAIRPGQELKGPRSPAKAYVTGQGDTLFSIARRFGVTADALRAENDLGRNASIYAGQKLRLPEGYRDHGPLTTTSRVQASGAVAAADADATPEAEAAPAPPVVRPAQRRAAAPAAETRTVTSRSVTGKVVEVEGRPATYTVRKGDTLERIADKLGTSVADLKEANHLRKSKIQPGQKLKGPSAPAKAYVAVEGDTLFSIAKRFGVTAEALRDENGLSRKASIHAGQKIRLPQGYRDRGPLTTSTRVAVDAAPATADEAPQVEAPATPPARAGARRAESPVAEPGYRSVTTRSVTGRVVEVEGPPVTYKVKKGDNLEKVARKLDTDVDQLKDDNHLRKSAIHPGQVLKGPRTTAKAYVVGPDDTLAEIAKRFGVTPEALRRENDLSRHASLRPGQKLRLPGGYRDHGPVTTTTRVEVERPLPPPPPATTEAAPPPSTYTPPPAPKPPLVTVPAPRPAPSTATPAPRPYTLPPISRPYTPPPSTGAAPAVAPTNAPGASDAQISDLGRGRFVWPLQGAIISDFGPKGGGQRNDGVNIGARAGDPVRAAAAGDVVYAGDQVPGFGNLVLIKHPDGWVTAYGHLSRVDVRMQQKVSQGQQIGQAGATGGVSEPQLHFEVRYAATPLERARPVDPKLVLPR